MLSFLKSKLFTVGARFVLLILASSDIHADQSVGAAVTSSNTLFDKFAVAETVRSFDLQLKNENLKIRLYDNGEAQNLSNSNQIGKWSNTTNQKGSQIIVCLSENSCINLNVKYSINEYNQLIVIFNDPKLQIQEIKWILSGRTEVDDNGILNYLTFSTDGLTEKNVLRLKVSVKSIQLQSLQSFVLEDGQELVFQNNTKIKNKIWTVAEFFSGGSCQRDVLNLTAPAYNKVNGEVILDSVRLRLLGFWTLLRSDRKFKLNFVVPKNPSLGGLGSNVLLIASDKQLKMSKDKKTLLVQVDKNNQLIINNLDLTNEKPTLGNSSSACRVE